MLRPIRRALLSVSDKTGLVDFARELVTKYGVELIATGGTRKALADAGLPVKDIAELTKFPEILDGRVKTLHPAIYAGLLAKRDKPEHMRTLAEHGLPEIDLVVCNLDGEVVDPGIEAREAIGAAVEVLSAPPEQGLLRSRAAPSGAHREPDDECFVLWE